LNIKTSEAYLAFIVQKGVYRSKIHALRNHNQALTCIFTESDEYYKTDNTKVTYTCIFWITNWKKIQSFYRTI